MTPEQMKASLSTALNLFHLLGLAPLLEVRIVKPARRRESPGVLVKRFNASELHKAFDKGTEAARGLKGELASRVELRVVLDTCSGFILDRPVQAAARGPKLTARAYGTVLTPDPPKDAP